MNSLGDEKRLGYVNILKYFVYNLPKTSFAAVLIVLCCSIFQEYFTEFQMFLICLGCILFCGYNILIGAFNAVRKRRFLHPDVYLTVAIIGTFAIGMYYEAIIGAAVFGICRSVVSRFHDWMEHEYECDDKDNSFLNNRKSEIEQRISNAITVFSVIALFAIVFLSIVIPVFWRVGFTLWLRRAFILFAAACPGALAITATVEYYKCINTACSESIYFASKDVIAEAAKVTSVAIGNVELNNEYEYNVEAVEPVGITNDLLWNLGAYACSFYQDEKFSAVVRDSGIDVDISKVDMYKTLPSLGTAISMGGVKVFAGNSELMTRAGLEIGVADLEDAYIYIAVGSRYAGRFKLKKAEESNYYAAAEKLREIDIDRIVMITSLSEEAADKAVKKLNLDEVWAGLSEDERYQKLCNFQEMQIENERIAFVADNFAETDMMHAADLGVAVGIISDNAAVNIPDGNVEKTADAFYIARAFASNLRRDLMMACTLKFVIILLAIIGFAGIWTVAVFDAVAAVLILRDNKKYLYNKNRKL